VRRGNTRQLEVNGSIARAEPHICGLRRSGEKTLNTPVPQSSPLVLMGSENPVDTDRLRLRKWPGPWRDGDLSIYSPLAWHG
jgi:hypothetical protein